VNPPLITIDAALHALASATTPDELNTLANSNGGVAGVRKAGQAMVAQNRCAGLRLRAERKLGELLKTIPRLHGRSGSVPISDHF
jgi:hypothetical protein